MIVAAALAATALGVAGQIHAFAGEGLSQYCFDNPAINPNGDDIPILTGEGGLWLGVEIGGPPTSLGTGNAGHVALCLSSTPPGSSSPETFGETITVNSMTTAWNDPGLLDVRCSPDPNANPALNPSCQVQTQPTYQLTDDGLGGATITVTIPFTLCPGPCSPQTETVGETGLLVGQLQQVAQPGVGAGFQLVGTQIWVNGIELGSGVGATGAYVNPGAVMVGALNTTGGPCVSIVCGPAFFAGFNTQPVAGLQIDGSTPINETSPVQGCILQNPQGNCP